MKKTLIAALLGLMTMTATMAQVNFQTMTITLKNGTVKTYTASQLDSVRFVGGEFNSATGVGVKIYVKNASQSEDYLYSQIESLTTSGSSTVTVDAPVISPAGGMITTPTQVTITCATSGAVIYYTIDGSTPSASSTLYNGPFTVSATTTIKAIAIKDGVNSEITTAIFNYNDGSDNNVNANWHETSHNIPQWYQTPTTSSATYNQAWRLEYPHINPSSSSIVVVKATSDYGISLSLELDESQRANRWTCFTMHNGVPNNNVGRPYSTFSIDDNIPTAYQVATSEYSDGKYTSNATNLDGTNMTLFSRGHICASEDRQSSKPQNKHTFITSNIHPQYQAHNSGLWGRMEAKVQSWGYSSTFRDTLYVCKGATITNAIPEGMTKTGVIPNSEVQSLYGVTITGTLTIPRYWYMAVLCLKNGQYHAMAYWTEQINSRCSSTTLQSCMITIDELERRTGIDFFCNLPDDIEATVEATLDSNFWQ